MRRSVRRRIGLTPVSVCPRPAGFGAGYCWHALQTGRPLRFARAQKPTLAPRRHEALPQPFLESPADFVTRAPNLMKLGQASRARQDLVWNSESTTKCGDYGDKAEGNAQVSEIRDESE